MTKTLLTKLLKKADGFDFEKWWDKNIEKNVDYFYKIWNNKIQNEAIRYLQKSGYWKLLILDLEFLKCLVGDYHYTITNQIIMPVLSASQISFGLIHHYHAQQLVIMSNKQMCEYLKQFI